MAYRRLTEDDVTTAAQLFKLPPELALAVWQQESGRGTNAKTSPKGAVGEFQVMPATFKRYMPSGNINDPVDNMWAGMKVLADGMAKSGGDPEGALQFYYHGKVLPPGVEGPTSGPGTPTTRQYAKQVLAKMDALKGSQAPTTPEPTEEGDNPYAATGGDQLDQLSPFLYGASNEPDLEEDNNISDIAGLTRPLSLSMNGEWLGQPEEGDYELDKYVRQLVDEELKSG